MDNALACAAKQTSSLKLSLFCFPLILQALFSHVLRCCHKLSGFCSTRFVFFTQTLFIGARQSKRFGSRINLLLNLSQICPHFLEITTVNDSALALSHIQTLVGFF